MKRIPPPLFAALILASGLSAGAGKATAAPGPSGFQLAWPLACEPGRNCWVQNYFDEGPGPQAQDYRCGHMTYDGHDGIDIRLASLAAMRRGVPVLAAAAGVVKAMRDGVVDASIRDPTNPHNPQEACGNAVVVVSPGGWQAMYCHMRKGSVQVRSGQPIKAGQQLGLVGLSGDTEFPHLHIGLRQGAGKVDPFAADGKPARCAPGARMLWSPAVAARLAYRSPLLINSGFAGGPVSEAQIDAEQALAPAKTRPLVVYVRAIGLETGDIQELKLSGPSGDLAATPLRPLDRPKATWTSFVGKKAPAQGWQRGTYRALYTVRRAGQVVLQRTWTHAF